MAFGGIDLGAKVALGSNAKGSGSPSGGTSTPSRTLSPLWIMGAVVVEASFLVYGRHVFRNYHGG